MHQNASGSTIPFVSKKLLMVAKLTIFIITLACGSAMARLSAQTVTLKVKNEKLEKVFREIKRQTGYDYVFNIRFVAQAKTVTVELNKADLSEALRQCFENQPFTYEITNKIIVIKEKPAIKPNPKNAEAVVTPPLLTTVHGKVVNEKGEPIAGVTVTVKGTTNRTSTNDNGEFTIIVSDPNSTLVLSAVSIETYEAKLNGRTELNIAAITKISQLEEVIVNKGYYNVKQRENTGDVTTVKGEDIAKQPVNNVLGALEGKVAGMIITQNTGNLNASYTVQIRGRNSISSGNDPLYIIDGVPYISQLLPNQNFAGGGGNPLNFINIMDIQSIDVLKDADATAIYGSRGANGVILITTKRGNTANTKMDVKVYTGMGKVTRTMDWLNTQQYLQMRNEAFKNDGTVPGARAFDLTSWDTTRNTDWTKTLIGGTAHYTDAQSSFSGGNSQTQYLVGGSYHKETTVFPSDFYDQKASVHFNINHVSSNQKFSMNFSGNFLADYENSTVHDYTSNIPFLAPDAPPIYNPDGTLNWANSSWVNPFSFNLLKYKGHVNNLVSNAVLIYKPFKGLELKTNLGYTNMQIDEVAPTPIAFYNPSFNITTSSANFNSSNVHSWIIEPQAVYQIPLGKGIFSALIGASFQQSSSQGQTILASGITSDALVENIQAATTLRVTSLTSNQYKYNAVFGRLNYNWLEKYLVNLTVRRDGSSRFGPGKQFADFGAAGIGYIFSKENFIEQHLSFLSFGKFRASYGTSGNDQIGDYRFLDLYSSTINPYLNAQGLYPTNLFNSNFAWEVNKKFEAGVELGFLKDKVFLTASYFRNRSSNQLVGYSLPAITGFTLITANLPATVENTGQEFALNTTNIKSKNFSWTSSFNLTFFKNKLVAYPNLSGSSYSSAYFIGQPLGIIPAFHMAGLNDSTGIYQFTDSKGNLTYSPNATTDKTVLINTAPKFYGGLQNSFQYKGFQLDIFLQFVKQTGQLYLYNTLPGYYASGGYNQPVGILDRWKTIGDKASFQKFSQTPAAVYQGYNYASSSDFDYGDASFIRLKNVAISWKLPGKMQQKLRLQNCRIYCQAQNLLTITSYKGMDPENITNQSTSIGKLPPLKVFTVGIEIGL